MTMHLDNRLSTLRTKKRKVKITKKQMAEFEEQLAQHNRDMKRQGRHSERMTIDEYVDYVYGRVKVAKPKGDYVPPKSYRRETPQYPSVTSTKVDPESCSKPTKKKYTGTLIKGIATMHKSNAVPVIDKKQAEEIANMRRG